MEKQKFQVIIGIDAGLVLEGLKTVLTRQERIVIVGIMESLSRLMEVVRKYRPDLLLIDLRLGGEDTIPAIRKVREEFPKTAVLVISGSDGSEDIYRSLRAGARGYVLKDVPDSELITAIDAVIAGRRYLSQQVGARLAERMDRSTLTQREVEVLQLIVMGKSNKEIADLLNVAEGTVKYHVNGILGKLGVTDRTQAATAALIRGIIHPQDL